MQSPIEAGADIRWRRAFAAAVDLGLAATLAIVAFRLLLQRFAFRTRLLMLLVALAAALLPGLYLVLRDAVRGKSVGKLLMGLTVVNPLRGTSGGVLDSVLRNLVFAFAAIPVIGWAVTIGIVVAAAASILSGRSTRLGEGLTDARVMDDRFAVAARQ